MDVTLAPYKRCLAWLVVVAAGGCGPNEGWEQAGQSKGDPPLAPPEDIHEVVCFYQPPFWKSLDPQGDPNPEGFKFTMYLLSRETKRGVLTEGVLQTRMYRNDRLPDGTIERTEVCSWTQDLTDIPRTRRAFELGWPYVPHFYWGNADVLGSEVEIVTWYETPKGRKVYARTQTHKVPARK
jgi:hypothetical protein